MVSTALKFETLRQPGKSTLRVRPPLCRHCEAHNAHRPRGLCVVCYNDLGIRRLYPPTSRFANRGIGDFSGDVQLPPAPTHALPGTPEKIAVLQQRARLGQQLWHPQDAAFDAQPGEIGNCRGLVALFG
jgi:hypothetical protein